jgi:hypothetical protein
MDIKQSLPAVFVIEKSVYSTTILSADNANLSSQSSLFMQKVMNSPLFIQALKQRDINGCSAFYDSYAPAFYGFLINTLHEPESSCEALEQAFGTIWSSIDDYKPETESLFTWSLKIVRKKASTKKIDMVLHEIFACQQVPFYASAEKTIA